MDAALDDIAFLANSENRVTVFEAVEEDSRSRDELREEVDASRVTVTRVLRELEERHWIESSGQEYAVTPLGEWVCDEFTRLVDELAAEQRLREPLQWFPAADVPFDVRRLRDAEILLLDESDATALVRRIIEFHRSGDVIRGVARVAAPEFIENQWDLVVNGETQLELVVSPEALDAVRNHPPSARRFRDMLDVAPGCYSVCEDIPISVGIVDDTVGINLTDEQGVLRGGLVTDDETVRSWAVDLFETCRENARPVTPDVISA